MHICLIHHYFIAPNETGGVRHYSLARYLVEQGHEVTVVAANFNHYALQHTANKQQADSQWLDGIRIIRLPVCAYQGNGWARLKNMLQFSRQVWRLEKISRTLPPIDIVFASSPHLFAAFAAQQFARRHKIPFVLEIRDIWPESLILLGKISRKHPLILLMSWMEKRLYRRADAIVSLLPDAKKHIQAIANNAEVSYLPNFVDKRCIIPAKQKQKVRFLYAGSFGLANQMHRFIEVFALLKNHPLSNGLQIDLIGEGAEKEKIQRACEEQGFDFVNFLPSVAKADIYSILANADVGFFMLADSPLYQWGISLNKLYDYLASALPVIFIGNSSNNPVVSANAGIHINTYQAKTIAEAFIKLANMPPEQRNTLGQRGREYALAHHELTVIGNQLTHLLENTLKQQNYPHENTCRPID